MIARRNGLIGLSSVVFVHAVLVSLESIAIEWLTVGAGIASLLLSGLSITIAGGAFMIGVIIRFKSTSRYAQILSQSWKPLLTGSALVAAGLITWYDSVSRIGASKEALLAGPLETVIIVLLARPLLKEKLASVQLLGVAIAIGGFFATVGSGSTGNSTGPSFSVGDIEAILSALAFGFGIIIVTKLTAQHSSLIITPPLLLISGLILLAALPFVNFGGITAKNLGLIALFSVLPLAAAYTYVVGLARIGASLTSTIASFSIVIVLAIQVVLHALGYNAMLPNNLVLAAGGGALAVFGIYLMHRSEAPVSGYATRHPI